MNPLLTRAYTKLGRVMASTAAYEAIHAGKAFGIRTSANLLLQACIKLETGNGEANRVENNLTLLQADIDAILAA